MTRPQQIPLILAVAVLFGTGTLLADEPATGYESRCALCHEDNGFGEQRLRARLGNELAVLSQRQDLTAPFIRTVVRHGFLAMPPMSKVEVPDSELDQIITYLTAGGSDSSNGDAHGNH